MSKLIKNMIAKDLQSRYADTDSALWVEVLGVDGNTTNAFRRDLHDNHMRMEVVRTLLLRRAIGDDAPMAKLAAALEGPAALITGGDSIIDVAKLVDGWQSKMKTLRVRGALLEGEFLDESASAGLAKMPNKAEMQARIAGIVRSPGANLAAAILAGGGNIAGCLKAMIEKLEDGEDAASAA